MDSQQYEAEITTWRRMMDDNLRRENSWLALAGLFWLDEGDNVFGSDPANAVVLPGEVAEHLGVFRLTADTVTLHASPEANIYIDDDLVTEAILQPDTAAAPTMMKVGNISMMVLQRESVYAIRLWDNGRSERHAFTGRKWYPIQPAYRLDATYTPYDTPPTLNLSRSSGADFEEAPVGYINFILDGQEHCLIAFANSSGNLSLAFKDKTSGQQTYSSGRYLRVNEPRNGMTIIDFNQAYNPPCFFTEYATCTLPHRENWLDVAIPAGEHK